MLDTRRRSIFDENKFMPPRKPDGGGLICYSEFLGFPPPMLLHTAIVLGLSFAAHAQQWPVYGGDPANSRYSRLKQIDRSNVGRLRVAWTYHTGDVSDRKTWPQRSAFETTPLMIDGILYLTTPFSRVIAVDAETGKERWSFDPKIDRERPTNLFINRGAAYWADGKISRVFLGTLDGRLFSLDARTGKPDDSFGSAGFINLRDGVADDFPGRGYGMTSPPAVYRNLIICGALTADGEPLGPRGDVRAFDARTGRLVWTFHTVARPGEFGNETWEGGSWKDRAAVNPWSILTVDSERGIVFLPLTSPATDFYGGDRKGANLFGDSLVALEASTGKRLWHFQTVHHNLWDYDIPAAPTLVTVNRDGRPIPAVAQVTKTGFTFVLDRLTGKPLFDVEERPVPKSEIPGEQSWPTQPFPVKPPPYARQSFKAEDLTDVTPESRAYCAKLIEGAAFGTLFTPVGFKPTVLFPGTNGGANWGGASYDPDTHTLFVNSMDAGMLYRMVKRPEGATVPYRPQGLGSPNSRFWDPNLWPCQKPPWGNLTAIDLDRGEFRWRVVLGVVDELIAKGLPPTGTANIGGSIVTAGGLVFIGATNDRRFRAFDKDTGRELWVTRLPASAHATPMTFQGKNGKQYVVVAAGGGNKYNNDFSDSLVAFSLP
jgi:quinoprotein glucose dehydrogenase